MEARVYARCIDMYENSFIKQTQYNIRMLTQTVLTELKALCVPYACMGKWDSAMHIALFVYQRIAQWQRSQYLFWFLIFDLKCQSFYVVSFFWSPNTSTHSFVRMTIFRTILSENSEFQLIWCAGKLCIKKWTAFVNANALPKFQMFKVFRSNVSIDVCFTTILIIAIETG